MRKDWDKYFMDIAFQVSGGKGQQDKRDRV